jgi:hypothetical protein
MWVWFAVGAVDANAQRLFGVYVPHSAFCRPKLMVYVTVTGIRYSKGLMSAAKYLSI